MLMRWQERTEKEKQKKRKTKEKRNATGRLLDSRCSHRILRSFIIRWINSLEFFFFLTFHHLFFVVVIKKEKKRNNNRIHYADMYRNIGTCFQKNNNEIEITHQIRL